MLSLADFNGVASQYHYLSHLNITSVLQAFLAEVGKEWHLVADKIYSHYRSAIFDRFKGKNILQQFSN